MHKLTLALFTLAAVCIHCDAIVFTRCGLVRELRRQGFPASQLRNWVCLIEAESGRNTAAVSGANSAGNRYWGLFQVFDRDWCSTTTVAGKGCNARCRDLTTDNITRASNCAKLIHRRHGFNAWRGWTVRCSGRPLPDISTC